MAQCSPSVAVHERILPALADWFTQGVSTDTVCVALEEWTSAGGAKWGPGDNYPVVVVTPLFSFAIVLLVLIEFAV